MSQNANPSFGAGLRLLAWCAILLVNFFFGWVVVNGPFHDRLLSAFESKSEAYRHYETYLDKFPNEGTNIFVYFEREDFAAPKALEEVADFLSEVQFLDPVGGVFSPFSFCVDGLIAGGDCPFSTETASRAELMDAAHHNTPALQQFISKDRKSILAVVFAPQLSEEPDERKAFLNRLERLANTYVDADQIHIAGYPVVRAQLSDTLVFQIATLTAAGAILGTLAASIAIGSFQIGFIATIAAATALISSTGLMILLGFEFNIVTLALPNLILVVSLAGAVHLCLEIQSQSRSGTARPCFEAVKRLAPAAAIAAITTSVALGSLILSPAVIIRQLGHAGFFGPLTAFLAVFAVTPLAFNTLSAWRRKRRISGVLNARYIEGWRWYGLTSMAIRNRVCVSLLGLGFAALSTVLYTLTPTTFSLFEGIARTDKVMVAMRRIEDRLTPTGAIHFTMPTEPQERLKAATEILRSAHTSEQVISLFAGDGPHSVKDLPEHLRRQIQTDNGATSLISVPYAYRNSHDARAEIDRLETALNTGLMDRGFAPSPNPATGLIAVSARVSEEMVRAFSTCFLAAISVSSLIISVWMRSFVIGLVAAIPNIIPVTTIGAFLYLSGQGMSFSGGVALTVAFGIAIDDTVHVLNRIRLIAGDGGVINEETIDHAMAQVSPALAISTIVLVIGSMAAALSSMPSIAQFAQLSILVFIVALICDLVLLPSLLAVVIKYCPSLLMPRVRV